MRRWRRDLEKSSLLYALARFTVDFKVQNVDLVNEVRRPLMDKQVEEESLLYCSTRFNNLPQCWLQQPPYLRAMGQFREYADPDQLEI